MTTRPHDPTLTAACLVSRAAAALAVTPRPTTVDGLVAGDPGSLVRGVAVTTLATLEVLERAVAAGANVVVTHEPPDYDHTGAADRKSTRLNSSHTMTSRMPSSA